MREFPKDYDRYIDELSDAMAYLMQVYRAKNNEESEALYQAGVALYRKCGFDTHTTAKNAKARASHLEKLYYVAVAQLELWDSNKR